MRGRLGFYHLWNAWRPTKREYTVMPSPSLLNFPDPTWGACADIRLFLLGAFRLNWWGDNATKSLALLEREVILNQLTYSHLCCTAGGCNPISPGERMGGWVVMVFSQLMEMFLEPTWPSQIGTGEDFPWLIWDQSGTDPPWREAWIMSTGSCLSCLPLCYCDMPT